jgi:hypothetical protein
MVLRSGSVHSRRDVTSGCVTVFVLVNRSTLRSHDPLPWQRRLQQRPMTVLWLLRMRRVDSRRAALAENWRGVALSPNFFFTSIKYNSYGSKKIVVSSVTSQEHREMRSMLEASRFVSLVDNHHKSSIPPGLQLTSASSS